MGFRKQSKNSGGGRMDPIPVNARALSLMLDGGPYFNVPVPNGILSATFEPSRLAAGMFARRQALFN